MIIYAIRIGLFRISSWFWTLLAFLKFRLAGVVIGKGLRVSGPIRVWKHPTAIVDVGDRLRMNSGTVPNPTSNGRICCIHVAKGGFLKLGRNVGMSGCTIVCRNKVMIGNNVLLGGGVSIFDNDFHTLDYRKRADDVSGEIASEEVIIEDDAFLGFNVTVLKGVRIGIGSVVGACSLVSRDVPDFEIWAGNPCKKIGDVK